MTARIPTGVATGIGSMPGTDPREAVAVIAGEVALPFLPELPARGVGGDLIGRAAGLLTGIPVDYVHRTYRLSASPTAETRRARDFLRWDLDALEEHWERRGLVGSAEVLKIQACGPFTVAAQVELRGGHKAVRDRGALYDIAESLAASLVEQAEELRRRIGVRVVVQLDEPSIGEVLDGTVTPLTRLDPIAPVPVHDVAETLETFAAQVARPMLLHSCAAPRWELFARLPSYGLALDFTRLRARDYDPLGAILDAGRVVAAGVVPVADPGLAPERIADELADRLAGLGDRMGMPRSMFGEQFVVTPVCGLAGAAPSWARRALAIASTVADAVTGA